MRPYELPQNKYALWYEIGQQFGPTAQAAVFSGLCDEHHKVYLDEKTSWLQAKINQIAKRRNVLLQFA